MGGLEPASFFEDIAKDWSGTPAWEGARAYWATTNDGVRVRVAQLGAGPKGTVLICAGRTEFVEKYAPAGRDFAARGFTSAAIDWRGQGLTERALAPRTIGHVGSFDAFARDMAAFLAAAEALALPRPWHVIGHSMGGAIALRALYDKAPLASAAFTGPMWGIALNRVLRFVAPGIVGLASAVGLGNRIAPTSDVRNYLLTASFEGNLLTKDPDVFAWMQNQLRTHPDLALGGPSIAWVRAALAECRALARLPAPPVPCLCVSGTDERIVDVAAIHSRMARWEGGTLVEPKGAEHEIMMEVPSVRTAFFDQAAAHFEAHGAA